MKLLEKFLQMEMENQASDFGIATSAHRRQRRQETNGRSDEETNGRSDGSSQVLAIHETVVVDRRISDKIFDSNL
jgi:hypothetical protein